MAPSLASKAVAGHLRQLGVGRRRQPLGLLRNALQARRSGQRSPSVASVSGQQDWAAAAARQSDALPKRRRRSAEMHTAGWRWKNAQEGGGQVGRVCGRGQRRAPPTWKRATERKRSVFSTLPMMRTTRLVTKFTTYPTTRKPTKSGRSVARSQSSRRTGKLATSMVRWGRERLESSLGMLEPPETELQEVCGAQAPTEEPPTHLDAQQRRIEQEVAAFVKNCVGLGCLCVGEARRHTRRRLSERRVRSQQLGSEALRGAALRGAAVQQRAASGKKESERREPHEPSGTPPGSAASSFSTATRRP